MKKLIERARSRDADAFTELRGFEVINDIAYKNQTLPFDSLICANDELAIGAIKVLKANGVRVPEDVLVAGFDNIEIGEYMSPTLSTVAVNWKEYGATMARLALDILNHNECKAITVPVQIIERESSKIS